MNSNDLSRRGFLSTAVGVGGMGANSAPENPQQYPEQAWFIVEQHWEHNDEFFVPDGEYPQFYVYYSEGEARAECQRLNDEFFATELPAEYPIEIDSYLQSETCDPANVTWDQLRAAGFRGPYRVQLLNTPTRKPPP